VHFFAYSELPLIPCTVYI